jgi:plasmid segregation protein ParM
MPIPVALDVGYGYTKLITSDKGIFFPSIVGRAERMEYPSENFGKELPGVKIILGQKSYFVGELAQRQSTLRYELRARSWIDSEIYAVLVLAAFQQAGLIDQPCTLVTGLPVDYYADRDRLITLFSQDRLLSVKAEQIRVIPQPFGTFFDLLLDSEGSIRENTLTAPSIGIIDIGHYTTDCIRIDEFAYTERASGSISGMSLAYEMIAREMKAKMAASFLSHHFAERLVRRWKEQTAPRPTRYLAHLIRSTLEDLSGQIEGYIQTLWSRDGLPDQIILTGGGAYLLNHFLTERIPGLMVVQDPHLANVRGYFKYAKRFSENPK